MLSATSVNRLKNRRRTRTFRQSSKVSIQNFFTETRSSSILRWHSRWSNHPYHGGRFGCSADHDLDNRKFKPYGQALVRLIKFIRALSKRDGQEETKVNIIAHSMGGLIVREAVQQTFPDGGESASDFINKVVTLGTPHKGISFQILRDWIRIDAQEELEALEDRLPGRPQEGVQLPQFRQAFPPERVLTVVGTNYRTYGPVVATLLN